MANNSVANELADSIIKSQIDFGRFGEGTTKKVMKLLDETQKEVIASVLDLDPTLKTATQWQKRRLIKLNKQINGIVDHQYAAIKKLDNKRLRTLASSAEQSAVKELNRALKADIFDITLTTENLKAIVNNTLIDGAVIGDWWDGQSDSFKKKFARQMADATKAVQIGTVRGEAVGELVRRVRGTKTVSGIMDISRKEATALVRTSTMQVANEARMSMYEANADLIDGYEAIAVLDARTTDRCRAYDRKVWRRNVDGDLIADGHGMAFPGNPPYHWQCRTTLIPVLKNFSDLAGTGSKISKIKLKRLEKKLDPSVRASMGGPTKEFDYNTWLKAQPVEVQIDILGPKRHELWLEHKLSMADMVSQDGRTLTLGQLRKRLGLGATQEQVDAFKEAFQLEAVSDARVRRFIDKCYTA